MLPIRLIGLKSFNSLAPNFFGIKAIKGSIEAPLKDVLIMKILNCCHYFFAYYILTIDEECHGESTRSRCLVPSTCHNTIFDLRLTELTL